MTSKFLFWGEAHLKDLCEKIPEEELTMEQNRMALGLEDAPEGRVYFVPTKEIFSAVVN